MKRKKVLWQLLIVLVMLGLFLMFLFYVDNKYQTPPPYGRTGMITLNERDLERDNPIFLIDGWHLTDGSETDRFTYIGEFSNLQRGNLWISPHGWAQYQLTLRYDGRDQIVSVDFPQLSFQYAVSLDGILLSQGLGSGRITFPLTSGDHVLTVETSSEVGYYSGMYFPPALSTVETLAQVSSVQSFSYAFAFLFPLSLAVVTLFLWRMEENLSRWFGLLCVCYALYMFHYFVFLFSMPVARYWFLVQNLALYGLCFCVVRLTALVSGNRYFRVWFWVKAVLLSQQAVLLVLCMLIPILPWAVWAHGRLTDIYYISTFCGTAFFTVRGIMAKSLEIRHTLTGCTIFGVGLLANLLFSNRFEPIRFFWQFEWCGLFLVLQFAVMMVSRSRRILQENDRLTNHLEEQVKKRTEEVTQLLEERKAFFSDMAHDLKAPVFATRSFIEAIRKSGVGVDMELQGYLDQAEAKQWEMTRRLQGLSAINALDKIEEERTRVSLQELLLEIYDIHHGESEVQSVYLIVEPPKEDIFLIAQREKLYILFENLIYNALKATPPGGSITVSAMEEGGRIYVTVEDTGCGIPKEELPLIFQRFYVGANNRETGTGLGLYIVQSIVTELGGTIRAWSTVGKGTKLLMDFPQDI
ncbi:MAG: HAMP domain-containing histidine kinase [Lachnospiraceae bacterium]|nr:HAMP domain-containing histidine kinase [Lachnospiraceae bacterium]